MQKLGWGIVGCGGAAFDVAQALDQLPDARVAAAHDRNTSNAESLASPRGAIIHDTLEGLLDDPAVDIVYVGLPHRFLSGVALAALRHDKHVLVEKPMALATDEIAELEREAVARDLRLGVYFELRRGAAVEKARELVRGGAIGQVRAVRITTIIDKPQSYWTSGPSGRVAGNWRASLAEAGGGVVLMNSIHQLDALRYISGLDYVSAMGSIATLAAAVEVEDTAAASLVLSNGALVGLVAGAHSPGAKAEEGISIDGEFGRLDLPDLYAAEAVKLFVRREWNGVPAGQWTTISTPRRDAHAAMLADFVTAVTNRQDPPATSKDAFAALGVVRAIYESSRTGRAVRPAVQP